MDDQLPFEAFTKAFARLASVIYTPRSAPNAHAQSLSAASPVTTSSMPQLPSTPNAQSSDAAPPLQALAALESSQSKEKAKCERWKGKLLRNSPMVRFMMQELEKAGCPFTEEHLQCVPCNSTRAGAFSPQHGVFLCQNQLVSKTHMEDTITHELIHAFDHCTIKMDWTNCEHYACTEIRAASLSGDCRFTRELRRGRLGVSKQHQACVKRRAILALSQLPYCQGPGVAENAVHSVWDKCFADTAPFDEIP
ncbi:peptidase M76 family-domain-containing protein [Cladochytrium replicatum]|nr:peptidase M76 family-domain-containing protein [Cladochytrium replicatum]